MHALRWVVCGLLVLLTTAPGYTQGPVATFNGIGDLSGGPFASTVRDAVKVGGVIHAVGASATIDQCLAPASGCTQTVYSFDTPAIWSWDGTSSTLMSLPPFVTLANPGSAATFAAAITPDASFIASQARSSASGNQMLAARVTRNGLVNLNLNVSPFPALTEPTGAVAISSNGSILYGTQVIGSFLRATRWDIDSSSSITIPLLNGTTGGNFPAQRGTSLDGTVMVGSSFSSSAQLENLRGFRYVHGTPGTVTAIPILAGGTWNTPLAISGDGNLVLVEGNSALLPNGEMYIYNATTGLNSPLGSPNTAWGANGFGGISADGSVVAVTFVSSDGSNRYGYFHNSHGWFHLASALGAAGVDVGASGWTQLDISGMTSDGAMIFGNGRHNGNTEGFVAEFPADYLAGFSVAPVAPASTSLVGTWILPHPGISGDTNPEVLLVMADGTYVEIENSGFERGRYSWNAATGEFKVTTVQDTNGADGISGANGRSGITFSVFGDNATFTLPEGVFTGTRVTSNSGSAVGGWVLGDPTVDNSSAALVLLTDGTYYLAQDGPSSADPSSGHDGIERGTYFWNFSSGAFGALTKSIDTDGGWGLDTLASGTATLGLSMDELAFTLSDHTGPHSGKRNVDPQSVVPVITSPLTGDPILGRFYSYTITASHGQTYAAAGLPAGLSINSATGVISGVPLIAGPFNVTISVTNSFQSTGSDILHLIVDPPTRADYDGDGKTDLAIFRNGAWVVSNSSGGSMAQGFGIVGDTLVSADYDGDHKTDIAVWRDGLWFILRSSDAGVDVVGFGIAGDTLVPGDYDGDGKTDIAVYRNGLWFIRRSSDNVVTVQGFGAADVDTPVPADYDGDGITDLAVMRNNGLWVILRSSDGGVTITGFGISGDTPIPADYDGDAKADIAVYRSGLWFILRSTDGGVTTQGFGLAGDTIVPADYDGDGKTDIAVFRNGTWFISRSSDGGVTVQGWGVSGDTPLSGRTGSTLKSYSTSFSLNENPLSENDLWMNGLANGLDWFNVRTSPGLAFGTQLGSTVFDDSTALLKGNWGPNQSAQATVHTVNQNSNVFEEVEIRLRSNITSHSNTGYEINFSCRADGNQYVQIVRWNGDLGAFTLLDARPGPGLHNGDVVKATMIGNTISAYINGTLIFQASDGTYTSGNPGIGFYLQDFIEPANPLMNADFGFTNFTATNVTLP